MVMQALNVRIPHSVDEMIYKDRPYRRMMKYFDERLKRIFRDSDDQELMDCDLGDVVQDDAVKRIEDGFLEITRQDMRDVFNPVVQEILQLVREQIDTVELKSQDRISVSSLIQPRKCTLLLTLIALLLLMVGCFFGGRIWVFAVLTKAAE